MSESNGNGLSSRERNLSGLPDDREIIFAYLDSLDLADKLLLRDQYYLFCGGIESKEERAITKILKKRV